MVQKPSYWKVLTRRKLLSQEGADGESKLNRVLGLYDLTALGVGSTLGAGVYVLAGQIAKDQAGPSVMLSFAIAALASLLAGLCYAEFGARVPKAGSAYVYSYVCIGEFAAFVIGWNLILEYMIGTASVCRGISLYLDTLINDTLKTTFAEIAPINVSFLGTYFDFFACGLVAVFGVALAFGVETSAIANNFCTCLNLFILSFVIIAGSLKANFTNWSIDVDAVNETDIPPDTDLGGGGFFPFGFTGTLKGAATCFFGFVGFDCIATTGEEVQNPRKNIPRSILLSLLIIFLCYFGVSTVITLMVPYYLQDANAPLPSAFKLVGWKFAMWIVSIGGLVGLLASLFGALFPLPRVMYSMAQDGLMFRVFAQIHPKFRVPVVGSIIAAMLTALIAGLFDLAQLVNLLSIGTLLAYSVVAISITILRYMDNADTFDKAQSDCNIDSVIGDNGNANRIGNGNSNHCASYRNGHGVSESSLLTSKGERITVKTVIIQLFNFKREYTPNELSTRIVGTLITLFCILSAGVGLIFMQAYEALINNQIWVLVSMVVLCILTALVLLCICLQPRELCTRVFTVPFVPLVPAISIFINIYLMLQLDIMTWIRFGVWMAIGIPLFVACWCMYDVKNPTHRHRDRLKFKRVLKLSSRTHFTKSEVFMNNILNTSILTQNEWSIKSLDDIMNLKEVKDELKEVKHPNGQMCYVEGSKSSKLEILSQNTNEANIRKCVLSKTDTSEEEKTIIALLDDILETEDEIINKSNLIEIYDRKASVYSENEPCVFRSTTVATVHSCSSSESSKYETNRSTTSIDFSIQAYQEKQRAAQELVDEILSSQDLWIALERHQQTFLEATVNKINLSVIKFHENDDGNLKTLNGQCTKVKHVLNSLKSVESIVSINSIDFPLLSEIFRNEFSKLIIKPLQTKSVKEAYKGKDNLQEYCPRKKYSDKDNDGQEYYKINIKGKSKYKNTQENQHIPNPPKFDRLLFKTVNGVSGSKELTWLSKKLLRKDEAVVLREEKDALNNTLPFTQRLEAKLIQGPSGTQTRRTIENGCAHFVVPFKLYNKLYSSHREKSECNLNPFLLIKEAQRT